MQFPRLRCLQLFGVMLILEPVLDFLKRHHLLENLELFNVTIDSGAENSGTSWRNDVEVVLRFGRSLLEVIVDNTRFLGEHEEDEAIRDV